MQSVGELFDIVTVHWFADGPELEYMMDRLVRPFAMGKPIWLSEVGRKPCAAMFGEVAQASLYQRVLDAYLPRRSWWTTVCGGRWCFSATLADRALKNVQRPSPLLTQSKRFSRSFVLPRDPAKRGPWK